MDPYEHDSRDHATLERLRNEYLKRVQYDYTNRQYERNTEEAILQLIPESKTPENKTKNRTPNKFQKTTHIAIKHPKPRMKTMATAQEKNRSKSKNNISASNKNNRTPAKDSNEK